MRINKFFAGVVTVGLLGLPVVTATSATAEDAPAVQTRVAEAGLTPFLKAFKKPTSIRGNKVSFVARVEAIDPATQQPVSFTGNYVLERRLAGEKDFRTVKSGVTYGSVRLSGLKVVRNGSYRLRITDGTARIAGVERPLAPTAATRTLRVMRKFAKMKANRRGLVLSGRVVPKHARKNVFIQRKNCEKGCKWKAIKRVKTNAKSRFSVRLPARKGKRTYFRAVVPKGKGFVKSFSDSYYTIRY